MFGGMGAFDGIKVLEAGLLVQGPQAAALLGDWGADVVKIELPGFGPAARLLGALLHQRIERLDRGP